MNFIRYNPLREFDDLFTRAGFAQPLRGAADHWVPRADVLEEDSGYRIELELAGVNRADVNVSLHEGVLRVSGETKAPVESAADSTTRVHRLERVYGKFDRRFKLPNDADPDGVDARFNDGVLQLQVRRVPQAQPKAIEVQTS